MKLEEDQINQFKCDQCDKIYQSLTEIQLHTSSAEYKNKSLAKCNYFNITKCSFKSCTIAGLEFHIELVHKNSKNLTKNTNKNLNSVTCDICQLDIASFGNSERILRIHKINNHSTEFFLSENIKNVNKELMQEPIQAISISDR